LELHWFSMVKIREPRATLVVWVIALVGVYGAQPALGQAKPAQPPAEPQSSSGSEQPQKPAGQPITRNQKRHTASDADDATATEPTKTVVRNGSLKDLTISISPGLSDQQIADRMRSTNQLLTKTNDNLQRIAARPLTEVDEDTVKQIKSYMVQSRTAGLNGDADRAYNLANKAEMLSADLANGPH
jgi:hypothetical protein